MPSTTNFGWTTPADTDLVKDGAAAIRTLGNGVDASFVDLKGGTTGQVLSKNSNTDLDFTWVAQDDSNAIQNALLTTTGDTIYASSASTPARLGIGSSGQVLTVSGGVPTWATPAGGGKVLQVVYASTTTETSITTTNYTDTGLSGTITPSAASSKILVFTQQPGYLTRSTTSGGFATRLLRGSTTVFEPADDAVQQLYRSAPSGTIADASVFVLQYLDSPNTTSATTYKTQGRSYNGTNSETFAYQWLGAIGNMILMEIGA